MPGRKENGSRPGYKVVDSFIPQQRGDFFDRLVSHQEDLVAELRGARSGVIFGDRGEPRFQSFEDASLFAAAEMATLALEYPQLIRITPTTTYLYPLLRGAELFYDLPRGSSTVMVGAGATIPEFLAQYVAPPSREEVEQTVRSWRPYELNRRVEQLAREVEKTGPQKAINLLPGKTVAIEPLRKKFELAADMSWYFLPQLLDRINPVEDSIQGALDRRLVPNGVNTILWHRVEPAFLLSPDSFNIDQVYLEDLLRALCDKLAAGGHIVISIGGGNNITGEDLRRDFLQKASTLLGEIGVSVLNPESLFPNNEPAKSLFFDYEAGMVGYVIARKEKKPGSTFWKHFGK